MKRLIRAALGTLLAAAVGCSGGDGYAPVSGTVTLDGKPYGKAVVSFQPIGVKGGDSPGRGSSAYTDDAGRYVLACDGTVNGAVVGRHQVRIMTRGSDNVTADPEQGSSDDTSGQKRATDPIPPEWHSRSTKEFDVPPGGTDKADFAITSRKAGKK